MEAPKIPRLFGIKTKRPNQFYFEPRYYDERKEKRGKRNAQIKREVELENEAKSSKIQREDFRVTLKENWGSASHRKKEGSAFNTRVVVYIAVLLSLAYFILR